VLSREATNTNFIVFGLAKQQSLTRFFLLIAGYNYYGTERLYSGVDGRELEADIFIGVVYYQRLRHMVSDKFQVCILHSNKREQQSMDRHVIPIGHIILIPSQAVFALSP
jgi:hypothetical protein